jgi:sorting nexin-4
MEASSSNNYGDPTWQQAGQNADPQDLAGPGEYGYLDCTVGQPQKEGEGTQNAYVSYLVTTNVSLSAIKP